MSRKKLLLHICCAPDATVGIERLSPDFEVEGFYYNPNIHPAEEYGRRLDAMRRLSSLVNFHFTEGEYDTSAWFDEMRGLENEPEKGLRCELCIRERLRSTASMARENDFDAFAAVLTISPKKNALLINRLGALAAEEFGVDYIPTDLKKKDGFKKSVELSREYGLYRQNYCGCEFSKRKVEARRGKGG